MYLKLFCSIYLMVYLCNGATDSDDLVDFDFISGASNETTTEFDELENNVEDYEDEVPEGSIPEVSKEEIVKEVIVNSMKSAEMKEKIARILPILRVMTPDQKLALASLVTTQVLTPHNGRTLTLDEVTVLFGNNPNTTAELMLPISLDVANIFRKARSEKGPTAEELRAPYRFPNVFRRNTIERPHNKYIRPRKPTKYNVNHKERPNCELFSNSICLKSHDYPIDAIMSSIRRNKHAISALLTDFKRMPTDGSVDGITPEQEAKNNANEDAINNVRRIGAESGFMCPSKVRYARPQRARATTGQWKYIVNTVEHTQTIRLEKCMKPGDTCTYLTDNFKSRCVQVYNYHRLLAWDQASGLHIDLFKVPSCCSCHIDNYKVPFPPHHSKHQTTSEYFPGEDIDNDAHETAISEPDQIPNTIPESTNYQEPVYQLDYPDINQYQDTKEYPKIEANRPSLSKYLEAPKPQQPFPQKQNYNQNFKRSNTPKPFLSTKRPSRPVRRRQPPKPIRDLIESESNFEFMTEPSATSTSLASKEPTKKINYNYHPIIDFFKPEQMESRMDIDMEESGWKPVTSFLITTEREQFQKR